MRICFFCENSNAVYLSNKILHNCVDSGYDIDVITLDWEGTVQQWVEKEYLVNGTQVKNICELYRSDLEELKCCADSLQRSIYIKNIFEQFFNETKIDLVIFFNDSSL